MKFDLTYISLGAGVQSSALLVCSALGLHQVPHADVAIFADTRDEPAWVYTQVDTLTAWSEPRGIPVRVVSAGCLSADVVAAVRGERRRYAAIPAFVLGTDGRAAPLRRQCTDDYKIAPIRKLVRQMLGYTPRQRVRKLARAMLGISREEAIRMRPSGEGWIENVYPLVDAGLTRAGCQRLLQQHLGPGEWRRSACRFCPYHGDAYWLELRRTYPQEFEQAARFDEAIRDMSAKGVREQAYLHRGLRPLRETEFRHERQLPLLAPDGFGSECGGHCGV